jgi:hypothetical protein
MGGDSHAEQLKGTHNVVRPLSQATRPTPMMPKNEGAGGRNREITKPVGIKALAGGTQTW